MTERTVVAVLAPILRWCEFDKGWHVLPVVVPSLSTLMAHGLDTLDRLLPAPE